MKKHYFRFLSFFLIFSLTISSCVFASDGHGGVGGHFMSKEAARAWYLNCYESIGSLLMGIVFKKPQDYLNITQDIIRRDKLHDDYILNGGDEWSWLAEHVEVNNSDNPTEFTLDDELMDVLRSASNQTKEQCDSEQPFAYYGTYVPSLQAQDFRNPTRFRNAQSFLESTCSKHEFVMAYFPRFNRGYGKDFRYLVCIGFSVSSCGLVEGTTGSTKKVYFDWNQGSSYPVDNSWGEVPVYILDCQTNLRYNFSSLTSLKNNYMDVIPNARNDAYEQWTPGTICIEACDPPNDANDVNHLHDVYYISCGTMASCIVKTVNAPFTTPAVDNTYSLFSTDGGYIPVYKTLQDLKNFGGGTINAPYYTVDPIGGQTVTSGQLNNGVNYGDIIGGNKYIVIPSPGNPATPVNPNPGGGGGGSDPSPNPGGGSGGGWNLPIPDFTGFFKVIGELIVSILSGIVELLKTVLQYLSTAITDLFTMINQIINSLLSLFNSNVLTFLQTVLAWLPPEITQLITLFITLSIVFGIVRLIRG